MHGRWTQLVRLGDGLTGDRRLAEDLAQTALARAYASWPRVRRSGNPDAYVNKIMVNAHRGRVRKRRGPERRTDSPPDPAAARPRRRSGAPSATSRARPPGPWPSC